MGVGIIENEKFNFNPFPNPSNGSVFIQNIRNSDVIELHNSNGQAIDFTRNENSISFDAKGVLILSVLNEGRLHRRKIFSY